jgi:hypothetical protein
MGRVQAAPKAQPQSALGLPSLNNDLRHAFHSWSITEMPEITEPDLDLSKEFYAAIGHVVVEWSDFEFLVDISTLTLAKINNRMGCCLTAQIAGSARKLDAYISIAQFLGAKKNVKALNTLAKDAQGLAEQRNRIVHDSWTSLGGFHRFEVTARKVLRAEFIPVSVDDLAKTAENIRLLGDRFHGLTKEVKAELEP